ncbi:MAG: aryl-sulfate sulfotransferase [Xanthobacteraceae bacterium]
MPAVSTIARILFPFVAIAATVLAAGGGRAEQFKVLTSVPAKMTKGTTAFIDTLKGPRLLEIDSSGTVVWQCSLAMPPYAGGDIQSGADVEWVPANDSFLVVIPLHGIFQVDRKCGVIRQHRTSKVSHDADMLPNGNILHTLGWDGNNDSQAVELDPAGKTVWSWQALGKLDESWRRMPGKGKERRPSYAHANAVVRLPNGDTLVSLRNFHRVVRVSPSGEVKMIWGPVPAVHEPNLMPDGAMVASNHRESIVVVLKDGKRTTLFDNPLRVEPMRTLQPVASGNFLLTGGEDIVEIDGAGHVVWHVKIYTGLGERAGNGVYKAVRVAK